jgi:hypothetical protein
MLSGCALVLTAQARTVDFVEFFGYHGIDLDAVRRALPVRDGGLFDDKMRPAIREAAQHIAGGEATDIAPVCCNKRGHAVLFIGLPGASSRPLRVNAKPTGAVRLAADFLRLYIRLDRAIDDAVKKGGDAPNEDDSQGFASSLSARAQTATGTPRLHPRPRRSHLRRARKFRRIDHRAHGATAIGYAQRSARQVAALVDAVRDPDLGVRDESTRAIGVLLRADTALASQISSGDFIEMATSGNWMDRNKGCMVLEVLTKSRDAQLLAGIDSQICEQLLEMARWRDAPHAFQPRMIPGRIRGTPEEQLIGLVMGPLDAFLAAIGAK